MTFVADIEQIKMGVDQAYTNFAGAQCAALVQQVPLIGGGIVPHTTTWRRGVKVKDLAWNEITEGTVIATFTDDGKYPFERRHTAIYISHDKLAILVIDQYVDRPNAEVRPLTFRGGTTRAVDNGDFYWVVETDLSLAGQVKKHPFYSFMRSTRFG